MDIEFVWNCFRQIVSAINYTHSIAGIIHRNLCLKNIFVENDSNIKIGNLGYNFVLDKERNEDNDIYDAPEISKGENKGPESDIWSIGICLYYMVTGRHPNLEYLFYLYLVLI